MTETTNQNIDDNNKYSPNYYICDSNNCNYGGTEDNWPKNSKGELVCPNCNRIIVI